MDQTLKQAISKVPEVTLGFWIIKVIATTLGETGGDAVTMIIPIRSISAIGDSCIFCR